MVYYVKQNNPFGGDGSKENPFTTISQAAEIAMPGDTVLIGDGIYREWVSPKNGGTDENNRITYKNIEGTHPIISGSEIVTGWEQTEDTIFKCVLPRSMFGDFCPFEVELGGDWYYPCNHVNHTGEVYANGTSLCESDTLEAIKELNKDSWYASVDGDTITVWVYMQNATPMESLMEVNVRPFAFFPAEEHRSYITVSGLTIENVATTWAPPTAFQAGAIGPHWSKGWIIENCVIRNSKCVGISLGKRENSFDNSWTKNKQKSGTQMQTESVFVNLNIDWDKEHVGSHIIRNNTIYSCGQAGIVGHMGGAFSLIEGNHIYNIAQRVIDGAYFGCELAGIKLHAGIDTIVRNNVIHKCLNGIWFDWEAQGSRITQNIFFDNRFTDIYLEVSYGPQTIDNNLLLSACPWINWSQGTALLHNVLSGNNEVHQELDRFTMYHEPHSTKVLGLTHVFGGDDRIWNNIYIGNNDNLTNGFSDYDNYNNAEGYVRIAEAADKPKDQDRNEITLGTSIRENVYFGGAKPCKFETAPVQSTEEVYVRVVEENGDYFLEVNLGEELFKESKPVITTESLGLAFTSSAPYENPNGTPLAIDTDLFGNSRLENNPCGPFATHPAERIKICSEKTDAYV